MPLNKRNDTNQRSIFVGPTFEDLRDVREGGQKERKARIVIYLGRRYQKILDFEDHISSDQASYNFEADAFQDRTVKKEN